MLQSLRNRRNRKGFTLAELLIVVAIIAVLVAIAIPLFLGALDDAEKRTFEANQHSVKSAAVAYILSHSSEIDLSKVGASESPEYIQATGTFKENGDFEKVEVVIAKTAVKETDFAGWKSDKTTIVVSVTKTELAKGAGA